jgi:hypothetical protein
MATRTIQDLPVVTDLLTTDLIHLGRPTAAATIDQDVAIGATDFYNSVNTMRGVYGAPTLPTALTTTPTTVTGFQAAVGSGSNAAAGSVTIEFTGLFEITADLTIDSSDDNCEIQMFIAVDGVELIADNVYRPNNSDGVFANIYYILAGTKYRQLAAGNVITLEVASSVARTATYIDGALSVRALALA